MSDDIYEELNVRLVFKTKFRDLLLVLIFLVLVIIGILDSRKYPLHPVEIPELEFGEIK